MTIIIMTYRYTHAQVLYVVLMHVRTYTCAVVQLQTPTAISHAANVATDIIKMNGTNTSNFVSNTLNRCLKIREIKIPAHDFFKNTTLYSDENIGYYIVNHKPFYKPSTTLFSSALSLRLLSLIPFTASLAFYISCLFIEEQSQKL